MKSPKQILELIHKLEKNQKEFGKTIPNVAVLKTLYWVLEEELEGIEA